MIDLGPNAVFIVSAYAGVIVVLTSLVLWTFVDAKQQHKRLADLEKSGIFRRSDTETRK